MNNTVFRPQLASVVTILATLIASPAFSAETQTEPEILGRRVPNFVLPDASGREVALSGEILQVELDLVRIRTARRQIADQIRKNGGRLARDLPAAE